MTADQDPSTRPPAVPGDAEPTAPNSPEAAGGGEGGHPLPRFEGAGIEVFLAAIVDSSDDVIIGKTLDGVIRSWNPAAERLFGYTAAEAVGQPITLIIPPDRLDEERHILARLAKGKRIDHFDTVRKAKDGHLVDISLTVSPIRGDDGRIVGASKIARDIGARKRAQEQLKLSEERFRALADNIAQLAWMADQAGSITWYNARWFEYTGSSLDEDQGWGWRAHHHPDHVDRVVTRYRQALERGEVWEDTFPLRRHDGAWRWFLSRAVPITDESGEVRLWFGTNTDISERMEMEQALREADQRKDEFLATLAHELRNPLAPIASGVELLRLRPNDPEVSGNVQRTLARQTAHLVRLVDDLLDVSRITRGKVALRRTEVELSSVVNGALEVSRPLIDQAGHQLTVELPSEPILLDADPVRLGQVFSNLLNNAAKYTPRGGRITIAAERREGEAVVEVSDTGLGFEPEAAARLFDLFVQDDRGGREGSGLGIGLTLARALVELHGGTVTATSEGPGQGSRFTVHLPLATEGEQEPPPAAEVPPRSSASPGSGLRVLIADDNRDAADGLCELLEVFGHDARAVYNGDAALASVAATNPQVVLLDLGMPGLDGYETARRLRKRSDGGSLVLIALTGWGQEEDRRRTRAAGFDHHLVKPADLDTLRRLLDEIGGRLDRED